MRRASKWSSAAACGAALLLVAVAPACSQTGDFQPVALGAKPWTPPSGWDPQPACAVGYYVAITSCAGCSDLSYALCDGIAFTQCVCGGPPWPGAMCPQTFVCSRNDFPPENWLEFTFYAGPGWAGLSSMPAPADGTTMTTDAGAGTVTGGGATPAPGTGG